MSSRSCWSATRSDSTSAWPWARSSLLKRWVFKARSLFFFLAIHFYSDLLLFRPSRRRWHAGTRACRTACVWATSPPYGTAPPSPSSGRTDTPSGTSSSQLNWNQKQLLWLCCRPECFCHSSGSRSGSARRGRTLRGRGSCWGRGSRHPWLQHLCPAWNRTSERAGATARRMKREITFNYLRWRQFVTVWTWYSSIKWMGWKPLDWQLILAHVHSLP